MVTIPCRLNPVLNAMKTLGQGWFKPRQSTMNSNVIFAIQVAILPAPRASHVMTNLMRRIFTRRLTAVLNVMLIRMLSFDERLTVQRSRWGGTDSAKRSASKHIFER
jgi:hypothetical protein